jgi:hypothetical protein
MSEVKIETYIKKPIAIQAVKWDDTEPAWMKLIAMGAKDAIGFTREGELFIDTLEGEMICPLGSYIIKGIRGEFYACKEEIFNESYEKVEE